MNAYPKQYLSRPHEVVADVLAAQARFSMAADRAIDHLRSMPEKARLVHKLNDNGIIEEFHLVRGVWVTGVAGCRMMLIDEKRQCGNCEECCMTEGSCGTCTRVLCEADEPILIPTHTHRYSELVTLIKGSLTEHARPGSPTYTEGKIYYRAQEIHNPEICGLMLICWTPPLIAP